MPRSPVLLYLAVSLSHQTFCDLHHGRRLNLCNLSLAPPSSPVAPSLSPAPPRPSDGLPSPSAKPFLFPPKSPKTIYSPDFDSISLISLTPGCLTTVHRTYTRLSARSGPPTSQIQHRKQQDRSIFLLGAMNFLLRSAQIGTAEQPLVHNSPSDSQHQSKHAATLEGLIAEDSYLQYDRDGETDGVGNGNGNAGAPSDKKESPMVDKYTDVTEDEGWITIPYKELPDNWSKAADLSSFHPLDRSFVFPGEQVHILACLSASKQNTEIITPFKVAAAMSKNGIRQNANNQNENNEFSATSFTNPEVSDDGQDVDHGSEKLLKEKIDPQKDTSAGESLIRLEDHKRQTEALLQRFQNSHFFVRITESGEPLWSKRSPSERSLDNSGMTGQKLMVNENIETLKSTSSTNAVIDSGNFNASVSGGIARSVECCSLSNGDIVVLLRVNIGIDFLRNPVLEILQFEKSQDGTLSSGFQDNLGNADLDPCGELLKWLLPLDNSMSPPVRPLSPPHLCSSSGINSISHRSNLSASSGSQLFSFGHFRSYSMSSLPQSPAPQPSALSTCSSRPNFDVENWDQLSYEKSMKSQKAESEGNLSFRGITLEPERFSVSCGLEGIYIPGRRWRRKLEIIQLIEISSFSSDCNTDDLLCVEIKNVSPPHAPDVMVFIDAITIVFEEASKGGPPVSIPIACIEAGSGENLPNLPLRRGEEHSFILKPASSLWKNLKSYGEKGSQSLQPGDASLSLHLPSKLTEAKRMPSTSDEYAVLVSCRCNYTDSRLFFKKATNWRPRVLRDLMISVASEMSKQSLGLNEGVAQFQLPVQILTLQASNLTNEDLTLTVLAPASFTSPPSVVSLNSSPTPPMSPLFGLSEINGDVGGDKSGMAMQRLCSGSVVVSVRQSQSGDIGAQSASLKDPVVPISDVIPSRDLGCTHLWLQSRVPLGCIPSQSMATIKLELLPLTDGIITLDTLQIDVKEKELVYVPEHTLKINATSSISTGIV